MHRDDLDRLIDERLAALPPPSAPPTLGPRVLDAVRSRTARPWYRRPWRTWPFASKAASIGPVAAAVLGFWLVEPAAQELWGQILGSIRAAHSLLTAHVSVLLSLTVVLRRTFLDPVVVHLLVIGLMTGVAAMALGMALKRVTAVEGVSK